MSLQVLMITMVTIFSGALIYAVKNAWKYWKSSDGANSIRVLFIMAFVCFIIHYSKIIAEVPVGYFSAIGGSCILLIYARQDLLRLLEYIKSRIRKDVKQ